MIRFLDCAPCCLKYIRIKNACDLLFDLPFSIGWYKDELNDDRGQAQPMGFIVIFLPFLDDIRQLHTPSQQHCKHIYSPHVA